MRELPDSGSLTDGLESLSGWIDLWLDRPAGELFAHLPAADDDGVLLESLYVESLRTGLGSNPVGLDRGQLGRTRLVVFQRVGDRVLLVERNPAYRASAADEAERRATEESFARSVLWAGEVMAQDPDGRVLIDLTSFLVRDAHGAARTLADTGQGSFAFDAERSVLDPAACHAFPDNVELEAWITLAGSSPGSEVRSVAPTPESVTLVQHHSFVRLPDAGYATRRFDPRMGHFSIGFADYSTPLEGEVQQRLASRHRPPTADDPLVYYVDRGAPEPVRSALVEGAAWWAQAFDAAGRPGAFRVELLPEGAHPLDVRYNVVQWVHRATRGWSYGTTVEDPRTGEILKGHVSLGSLRVRQDRLLFEGLLGTSGTGSGAADDPVELALARLRQLSAHEVGHTLGLAHNFAASSYGRASVMDYPAPWIRPTESGDLETGSAYAVGMGTWDLAALEWLYRDFEPGTEAIELERLARSAPLYLTDQDARAPGTAHPAASLWDNGGDPVLALHEAFEVRRIAIARFGEDRVALGQPLARLEEVLAPLYFHHRYQVTAAAKLLGGLDYRHGVRGNEPAPAMARTSAKRQRAALAALLECLEPAALDLPEAVLERLAPAAPGAWAQRETFAGDARPAFDSIGAARTAADLVLAAVLQPQRAQRLVDQRRRDAAWPGFAEVLDTLFDATFGATAEPERLAELRRAVQASFVHRLIELAGSAPHPVRTRSRARLARALELELAETAGEGDPTGHLALLRAATVSALEGNRPLGARVPAGSPAPPGSPIGSSIDPLGTQRSPDRPDPYARERFDCSTPPPPGYGGSLALDPAFLR